VLSQLSYGPVKRSAQFTSGALCCQDRSRISAFAAP